MHSLAVLLCYPSRSPGLAASRDLMLHLLNAAGRERAGDRREKEKELEEAERGC
ncbi:hypothetical protein E2C01_102184 [Portunus trituberculatus]|uniref:Uncharacterized protein n=1 Tax=Portunus trituberculatus TaxID=210409 RepID=A0A5B7KHS8_PORTR|nr:hypothetical protein [Portunus trituberculatus]